MTTTIHAASPLYVGPPYATASFNEFVTVLHVLVGAVFVLSGLVAMVAVAVMVFSGGRGCGPSRAPVIALPAMVVYVVTGASTVAWAAAGTDMGLLTPARRDGARGRRGVVHHAAGAVVVGRLLCRVP